MIKLKVSYEHPEELQRVLKLLGGNAQGVREPKEQKGKFRKVYITLTNHGRTTGKFKNETKEN